jgi:hypothetical protein
MHYTQHSVTALAWLEKIRHGHTFVFLLRHRSQLLWTRWAFELRLEVLGGRGAVMSAMADQLAVTIGSGEGLSRGLIEVGGLHGQGDSNNTGAGVEEKHEDASWEQVVVRCLNNACGHQLECARICRG